MRRLLDRHEAARQAGPGARPRPAAAPARRADERPRSGRSRRDARPRAPHRHRVRDRDRHGQPPARGDRAGLRLPRGHRRRPAAPRRAARDVHRRTPGPSRSRSTRAPTGWRQPSDRRRGGRRRRPPGPRRADGRNARPGPRHRRRSRPRARPTRAAAQPPGGPVPRGRDRRRLARGGPRSDGSRSAPRDRGHRTDRHDGSAGATSSIYDLGYRRYGGPRLGRRGAIVALATHSLRTALGLGRSTRSKIVPVGLLVVRAAALLVALGIAAVVSRASARQRGHRSALKHDPTTRASSRIMATLVMLFSAAQAPELFGRDQRDGVLPLYFSRAIARFDYAGARTLGLLRVARAPRADAPAAPPRR